LIRVEPNEQLCGFMGLDARLPPRTRTPTSEASFRTGVSNVIGNIFLEIFAVPPFWSHAPTTAALTAVVIEPIAVVSALAILPVVPEPNS
jgi:hypothetical protein